jgi:uncharacterized protein
MIRLSLVLCGAALLVGGCTILPPREDLTRSFVLSPAEESGAGPADLVVLGPLRLPDYLLRPEIVTRTGSNELLPSARDRWAEPLDRGVLRVLRQDLTARLGGTRVVAYAADASARIDQMVEIEITAFEADASGRVRLQGRWHRSCLPWKPGPTPEGQADFDLGGPVSGEGTAAVVAGLSAALGQLADAIAVEVRRGR